MRGSCVASTMSRPVAVVVTSINRPTTALHALAQGCGGAGQRFILVGDTKSPPDFVLDGCEFFDIASQLASGLAFARSCPTRHYARKNIGYLLAIRDGAPLIVETDDDNVPLASFFAPRARSQRVRVVQTADWLNVYRYFSEARIWPRGLPLGRI